MKRVFITIVLLTLAISSFAQEKDVTKFLGIPVDGTKAEMIAKLKEKGFTSTIKDKDILEGEFNGTEVRIHIATNNNKVCRIMVCDKNTVNETDIKIRFNKLLMQFIDNNKYFPISTNNITDEEDISYNIALDKKRYEASFIQINRDSISNEIRTTYTKEELEKISEDDAMDIILPIIQKSIHKYVWFMISEFGGEYYITMFYDNELNRANGEDL